MVKSSVTRKQTATASILVFVVAFVYYSCHAATLPTLFNIDYMDNWAATTYLAENHRLPIVHHDTPGIRFTDFGTTRLLRPPLSFMVSAVMMKLGSHYTDNPVLQQRLGAALMAALTLVFVVLAMVMVFERISFGLAAAIVIGTLPKFTFLASCNNDDIGAILSASMLFAALTAVQRFGPRQWVLLAIAASFGLVIVSKFTAWLLIPWALLYCVFVLRGQGVVWRALLPKMMLVFILCGGWWLLYNMTNYGIDDPTAIGHAVEIQAKLSSLEPNRQGYQSTGVGIASLLQNHDQFISKTARSAVGYLEWIDLDMGAFAYAWYGLILFAAMFGFLLLSTLSGSRWRSLDWIVLLMTLSQCLFYLHHNLVRDIQPEARYLLPLILPLVYLLFRCVSVLPRRIVVVQAGKRRLETPFLAATMVAFISLLVHLHVFGMVVTPTIKPMPYYTALGSPKVLDLQTIFDQDLSPEVELVRQGQSIQVSRRSVRTAVLQANTEFCSYLSSNTLVVIELSSTFGGAVSLRLDRDGRETYQDVHWGGFSPGAGQVLLVVADRSCSAARLTLSNRTQQLTIRSIRLYPLNIAYHGMPFEYQPAGKQ